MRRFGPVVLWLVAATFRGAAQEPAGLEYQSIPVLKVDENVGMKPPKAIKTPEIEFPYEARLKQINGKCAVKIVVGPDGSAHDARIVRCSDPSFAENSLKVARKYQFQPATNSAGDPVPVLMEVRLDYWSEGANDTPAPVRIGFGTPPGTVSSARDSAGVYPLTQAMTPPAVKVARDQSYADYVFDKDGPSPCELTLTIDARGKASNPISGDCGNPKRFQAASKTLLADLYEPARLHGKRVAVRTLVHVEFADSPPR